MIAEKRKPFFSFLSFSLCETVRTVVTKPQQCGNNVCIVLESTMQKLLLNHLGMQPQPT